MKKLIFILLLLVLLVLGAYFAMNQKGDTDAAPVELSISNNDAYNKIYFKNGGENVSVSSGQTWNQMTNYVLDYIN